jgi:hypothetical protein
MTWKPAGKIALYALVFVLYLASTIPVGLFLYSLKSAEGINIFKRGGFHAYLRCLNTSFPLDKSTRSPKR